VCNLGHTAFINKCLVVVKISTKQSRRAGSLLGLGFAQIADAYGAAEARAKGAWCEGKR